MSASQARLQEVKEVFGQLLLNRAIAKEDDIPKQVHHATKLARSSGGCLLRRPRRGAVFELQYGADMLAVGDNKDTAPQAALAEAGADQDQVLLETWREAEALLLAPHTFSALRQLPELQQIIAFTAVEVIQAAGAPLHHMRVADQAARMLPPASHASSDEVLQAMRESSQLPEHKKFASGPDAQLIDLLSPHMRLALAADVAVGMLCPGQQAPRDTLEHAAALQLFINRAADEVLSECTGGAVQGTVSALRDALSTPLRLGPEQTSALRAFSPLCPPPAASAARSWALAPHIDLQLQVPPQLLLQHLVQRQQQQQQQPAAASSRASKLASYEVHGAQAALDSLLRGGMVHVMDHLDQEVTDLTPAADSSISPDTVAASVVADLMEKSSSGFDQELLEIVVGLCYTLVLRFLASQLSVGGGAASAQWQQAVPLQALQLLAGVRQVEAAGQAAVEAASAAAAAAAQPADEWGDEGDPAHGQLPGESPAAVQSSAQAQAAAQQRLTSMLLSLLHRLRHYSECNAALGTEQAGRGSSCAQQQEGPCLLGLTPTPPHEVFGAGSRLYGFLPPEQRSMGLGLWWRPCLDWEGALDHTVPGRDSTSGSRSSDDAAPAPDNSASRSSSSVLGRLQAAEQHTAVLRVLTGTAYAHKLLQQADARVRDLLRSPLQHLWQVCAASAEGVALQQAAAGVVAAYPQLQQQLQAVLRFLSEQGRAPEQQGALTGCVGHHGLLAIVLHSVRWDKLKRLGADAAADAWIAHVEASGGLSGLQRHSPDADRRPQALQSRAGVDSNAQEGGSLDWDAWGTAMHSGLFSGDSSSSSSSNRLFLHMGRQSLRQLLAHSCHGLQGVHIWQLRQLALNAKHSWRASSPGSVDDAAEGSGVLAGTAEAGPGGSSLPHSELAGAQAADQVWMSGPYDSHPECSLCRQEQQQQQKDAAGAHPSRGEGKGAGTSSSSSSSSPFSTFPVAYDDPFLWRRLLWRLLGKLSPEAQAFFGRRGVCPHSKEPKHWMLVCDSLRRCLWSPEGADLQDISLSTCHCPHPHRAMLVRQYSRALNNAFVTGYHPSLSLVSKQVLLALSPLHHQVLPPPETAHLLPSSFVPAVGKALMQQLFDSPVLDGFEHEACPSQLWHVWWHVGLRVYAAQQRMDGFRAQLQSQRSQPQHGSAAAGRRSKGRAQRDQRDKSSKAATSNSSSRGSASGAQVIPTAASLQAQGFVWSGLSSSELETLYLDPQARLFAVSFATHQLSGLPQQQPQQAVQHQQLLQLAVRQVLDRHVHRLFAAAPTADEGPQVPALDDSPSGCAAAAAAADPKAAFANLAAAATLTDATATGQPELLAAVSGPRDLLIPPGQQRVQPTADSGVAGCQAMRHYLAHCPGLSGEQIARIRDQEERQQQQRQQQQQQGSRLQGASVQHTALDDLVCREQQLQQSQVVSEQPAAWPTLLLPGLQSDVSALALQSPGPVEALGDPLLWWGWQQELTGLLACDECGAVSDRQRVTCCQCYSTVWCSQDCCNKNSDVHSTICGKLQAMEQRYGASGASVLPQASSFPALAQLMRPSGGDPSLMLAGALSGLDGPAFIHGKSLVSTDDLTRATLAKLRKVRPRSSGSSSSSEETVKRQQRGAGKPSEDSMLEGLHV